MSDKLLNIITSTREYFSHFDCAVLGLSGGIDSALVLNILARSLNGQMKDIRTYYMPEHKLFDNDVDIENKKYVDLLLSQTNDVNITYNYEAISGFEQYAGSDNLAYGNLCSRLRMALLYYHANTHCGSVVGTTNKTEYVLGYFTKYGDGGVDVEPIIDLTKNEVYMYSRMLGVPEFYIKKTPSADLYSGQSDESEIGVSYTIIEKYLFPETNGIISKINFKDFSLIDESDPYTSEAKLIKDLVKKNQHKKSLPVSFT